MSNIIANTELELFKKSGQILASSLRSVKLAIKPGMPASGLEEIAETEIRRQGGIPSFKNYPPDSEKPFPAALCVSINNEVVHGSPDKDKVIRDGDIVSLDLGCHYKGMFTDMAITVAVGKVAKIEQKLIEVTRKSLQYGIDQARVGKTTGDIGHAIETYVQSQGFSVVRDLVGHGVGHNVHEDPSIPNFGSRGSGIKLVSGMGLAIEPMVNIGRSEVYVGKDGWTIFTKDGKKSAHFEKTIYLDSNGPTVITPFI